EHSEKAPLFEVLDATDSIGVVLTENFAMWPGAAVSGFFLSHPDSQYFAVAKIERDQVEDYARRKGWTLAEAERWLAPNLAYQACGVRRAACAAEKAAHYQSVSISIKLILGGVSITINHHQFDSNP
ncbi:MAG: vitamin B12 dependent-methionine synthase activation domain-containing protein, partial [Thiobacillus sp.]|nr:vitamin B12 dependent-methionine synthase activation domain-containing protein [Thiobacillus sp.]